MPSPQWIHAVPLIVDLAWGLCQVPVDPLPAPTSPFHEKTNKRAARKARTNNPHLFHNSTSSFSIILKTMISVARTVLLSAVAIGYVSASPAPTVVTVFAPIPEGTIRTASILGVDKDGHTTYAIDQPAVEGLSNGLSTTVTHFTATLVAGSDYASETLSISNGLSTTVTHFTATLVAGSDYASETLSISYSDPNFNIQLVDGGECTISGNKAICNDGSASTLTTDAAFATASLTQVIDVVGPAASGGGSGSGSGNGNGSGSGGSGTTSNTAGGSQPTSGAAGRSALCVSAVAVGAAFALLGSVL
uniref:GPI anchored protein n=1 Tax=Mycena chlorophos TaxID=658473 RepID=A0ABQ0MCG9_MYCCL|nr:predicted protein [Mycena chlorophos]